ncbi:MAG: 2Fe-2S iron-sulfur cluster-binding protein [candidate division Zixibacteria bacterium]
MLNMQINGKMVKAVEGEYILNTIRREGIDIPVLCDHKALEPCGACRLCMVEISKPEWDGWTRHVTSCLYPAEEGLIINTHTPQVTEIRRTILDLYLARCPNSDVIQKMAGEYGIQKTSFETIPDGDNCIMCYACTRACEVLGKSAISAVQRGPDKAIAPPFDKEPPDCIGCLSCAHVCPTNVIEWNESNGTRTIWNKKFEMISCAKCGKTTTTREFAEYIIEKRDIPKEYFDICDDCKRTELAQKMGRLVDGAKEVAI